ncbi:MAG: methyltransferase domain-containing protein [Xanthomonadaceae bacterium]|nr:methyltransferase domain-containing protein [Xanthomonadaceae bacterium]
MLAGLVARYRSSGSMDRLMPQHRRYWEGESAVLFHAVTEARCRDEFHRVHGFVPDMLGRLAEATGLRSICEIGCGSGVVLAALGSALPQLRELIGLDLSAEQTAINRSRHRDPRFAFAHGNACQWIPRHAHPGTIFMTYGGVFEYFAESAMRALLQDIASLAPAAVVLIEPIALGHDLERDFHSRPHGDELSLSHNYPWLLAQSGFTLMERRECTDGDLRWLAMTATIAHSPQLRTPQAVQPPGV